MKQEKIIGITFAALGAVLVVLCGNHDAQPIVNSGSLY